MSEIEHYTVLYGRKLQTLVFWKPETGLMGDEKVVLITRGEDGVPIQIYRIPAVHIVAGELLSEAQRVLSEYSGGYYAVTFEALHNTNEGNLCLCLMVRDLNPLFRDMDI